MVIVVFAILIVSSMLVLATELILTTIKDKKYRDKIERDRNSHCLKVAKEQILSEYKNDDCFHSPYINSVKLNKMIVDRANELRRKGN